MWIMVNNEKAQTIMIQLSTMKPGDKGIVHEITVDGTAESLLVAERLREMGFGEGLNLEVRHDSPFGRDPMVVKVGDMLVALRRKEATQIIIAIASEAAA